MKSIAFLICVVFLTMNVNTSVLQEPVVQTDLGKIQGVVLTTLLEKSFFAFRGIRYGKAPIDELRFKAPVPVEPWTATFDATTDGPASVQRKKDSYEMSEDCLRLNVYTPELPTSGEALNKSVLFYIHGGAYYIGSGLSNDYGGPYYLMDHDIVLVTINYRLGLLGFLSLGIPECPGNAGFKDQVLALKWVQSHISKFGGDPNRVTIMGHSAGGFSAVLHMVSPMSKGLFHQVIPMSGAILPQYSFGNDQISIARRQASLLGCPSSGTVEMLLECFRQVNVDDFAKPLHSMFDFGKDNPAFIWNAVIEPDFGQERFLTDNPHTLLAKGAYEKVPVLTGITKDELAYSAVAIVKNSIMLERFGEEFNVVAPICFLYERETNKSKEISAVLKDAYELETPLSNNSLANINEIFADGIIGFGTHRFVNLVKANCPVYYYRFSYKGRYSHLYYPGGEPYGVEHLDDMIYLLVESNVAPIFSKDAPELEMIAKMTKLWSNFVMTGNPNGISSGDNDIQWLPTDATHDYYLDIDSNSTLETGLFSDRYHVWDKIFPVN